MLILSYLTISGRVEKASATETQDVLEFDSCSCQTKA